MFTAIEGMPQGAIGFAASGRVTMADRECVLEPTIEWAIERSGKVRLLYLAGPEFDGYEQGAPLDDAVFGTRHFTDFAKIAFVAEDGPYDRAAHALEGLMPAALKFFRTREIAAAKAWLAG
jgi:hypothetical protein